jgi:hypothetical protein
MIKIIIILSVLLSPSAIAIDHLILDRGLCVIPKYKNTFVSNKEKVFYENAIGRSERCVAHIISENNRNIKELNEEIKKIELVNENTLNDWNEFKLERGDK